MDKVDFDDLSLERLRNCRGSKRAKYDTDVLHAWFAQMDFALAPSVHRALQEAIELGDCGYAHEGEIRQSFARFARRKFDWGVNSEALVLMPDVMSGVAEVLRAFTSAGEGVVINHPVYPPFYTAICRGARRIVTVPLQDAADGWQLELQGVEAGI